MDFYARIGSANGRGSLSNTRSRNFSDKVKAFTDSTERGHPGVSASIDQMIKLLVLVLDNMGLNEMVLDSPKFVGKPAILSVPGTKKKPASPVEEKPVRIRVGCNLWIRGMGRPPLWEGGIIRRGGGGSRVS